MGRTSPTHGEDYGREHREARKRLLPLAYGRPCPLCGRVMLRPGRYPPGEWQHLLDCDHVIPLILGGGGGWRICHRRCNRAAGPRLRAAIVRTTRLMNSQRW